MSDMMYFESKKIKSLCPLSPFFMTFNENNPPICFPYKLSVHEQLINLHLIGSFGF